MGEFFGARREGSLPSEPSYTQPHWQLIPFQVRTRIKNVSVEAEGKYE